MKIVCRNNHQFQLTDPTQVTALGYVECPVCKIDCWQIGRFRKLAKQLRGKQNV